MIDLCIDARMAYSSGIGTCIRQIVPFFKNSPFCITLLVDQANQSWCDGFEQILFPSPIYSVQEQLKFPLKIPKCDLFWSPHYNVPLLPIRAKKRIVTIHDACHLALQKYLSPIERVYAKIVMRAAYHLSDAVLTDSNFSKEELQRYLGAPRTSIHVIPMAVNKDRFRPTTDVALMEKMRVKYALPRKFFLFVGNLKPHKNLSGLLQAFSKTPLLDTSLVLVGKSKGLRNAIEQFEEKRVLVLDNVPDEDLPALYSMAELFILPSFYEGFGLPPLEAMSCGCPTLVSNAASIPEACGDASHYFDPENVQEMAEAMVQVAGSEKMKKRLIERGLKRVELFSWEQTARTYQKLFEDLV